VGNRAGSTPAPGTKTASKEAVFLVLGVSCSYGSINLIKRVQNLNLFAMTSPMH